MPAVYVRKGRRDEISVIKEDEHNKILLPLYMILALTPLNLGFYSFRGACSPETRGMSWIYGVLVVTSRSLFQTVGYQVTCMHITVSLITLIELLSIHCKHDTHKSTVLVRFCFAEP